MSERENRETREVAHTYDRGVYIYVFIYIYVCMRSDGNAAGDPARAKMKDGEWKLKRNADENGESV